MARKKTDKSAKGEELRMFVEYDSPDAALEAIKRYIEHADKTGVFLGEASMAQFIQVPLKTLREWYDGKHGEAFKQVAQWAYQEIAVELETNDEYAHDKVLSKRGWSMMKQPRFQGYQDKTEEKVEHKLTVHFGKNMDDDCF